MPARALTEPPSPARLIDEPDHPLAGFVHVRICPHLIVPERILAITDGNQAVAHQAGYVGIHEFQVPGPRGRDHRLTQVHRFGQESATRDLPVVLLLDQNHLHWEENALKSEHRVVAKMPIKMRELRGALMDAARKKVS